MTPAPKSGSRSGSPSPRPRHRAGHAIPLAAAALAAAMAIGGAQAQSLDRVEVRSQGDETIARIGFDTAVRVLPSKAPAASALAQVSFELLSPGSAAQAPAGLQSRRVEAAGAMPGFTVNFEAKPGQARQQLTLQFSSPVAVASRQGSDGRSVELVFRKTAALAPASDRRYALRLQVVPLARASEMRPIPAQFQRFDAFTLNTVADGVPSLAVHIGYFATEQEALAVMQALRTRFPDAELVDLPAQREKVLAETAAKVAAAEPAASAAAPAAPAASAAPAPAPAAAAPQRAAATPTVLPPAASDDKLAEVDRQGEQLLERAKAALAARRNEEAINALNQLLLLPPNRSSQDAQEIVGLAWERSGDLARARTEYELYLRLFPEGEGAERVRQRLAAIAPETASAAAPSSQPEARPAETPRKYSGSIAQYYYGGKARSQSLVNLAAGVDQATLTQTTESAIVTSVDLGGRYDSQDAETRVVVRGTGSTNLASTSHNASVLNAAYVDYKQLGSGLQVRLGRQSAVSGGLLGLFDGVSLSYPASQKVKIDLMGGVPANTLVSAPSQRLLAAMVEADNIFDRWGGDIYLVDQTSEGVTNRRGFGTEVRYADERGSMYSLVDYDTSFRKLNAVSLQGSMQVGGKTTVTLLLDRRRAPSLELTNALISSGLTSLQALLQQQTLQQAQDQALATSAIAKQALLSVSRPLNDRWQMAVDLRYSEVGALPAVGNFEATPATGAQYALSAQLTGTNLYSSRDINSFSLSHVTSPQFTGTQAGYSNLTGLLDNTVTLEPSMRVYSQTDNQGLKLQRYSPGLRISYKASRRASLLGETLYEHSKSDSPTGHSTTNSAFFYVGYRYELF